MIGSRITNVSDLLKSGYLVIGDGYRAKNDELSSVGIPFARAGNIDGGFDFSNADYFPVENLTRVGNKISQPGDVVFTSKGTVGRFAFVRRDTQQFVYSPQLCFWRSLDWQKIHPQYLFYWMQSAEFLNQVRGVAVQTDMAEYVSLSDQRRMRITLPTYSEQVAIAEILGVLDEKIVLNRNIADTMEVSAHTIFRSWFVNFDPIHRKSEGRSTGLHDDLAALFPDAFDHHGRPEGWNMKPLADLYDISGGNTPKTESKAFWDGSHHWATPKDLSDLVTPVLLQTSRKLTTAGLGQTSSGLLPPGSLLLSTRAPIGYLAFVTQPTAINQGLAGFVRKTASPAYAWAWCHANMDLIVSNAGGSTFQEITKNTLRKLQILVPTQPVLDAFNSLADKFIDRIENATLQMQTLTELRNTTLPKLISNELTISKAEKRVVA